MDKCREEQEEILVKESGHAVKVCSFKKSTRVGLTGRRLGIARGQSLLQSCRFESLFIYM